MRQGLLTVVIPAYNEGKIIERTAFVMEEVLNGDKIPHELLFVDDGSGDDTWEKIETASAKYENIRGIRFSRNFGKEAAIMAGLSRSRGDCCAVIDCDLQHPPEKLCEMYSLWQQGCEVIEGKKRSRGKEGALHALGAGCFYKLIGAATGFDMEQASDFKLLDRRAVEVIINMRERNTFFRALSKWIGFKTASVEFDVSERIGGKSKWSPLGLAKYALSNISAFSAAPMQIVTALGGVMLTAALILGAVSLVQKLMGKALEGFTTIILLQLFSSSIIMISLGIIGYYIAKIYEEVKDRPRYIIAESCGEKKDDR